MVPGVRIPSSYRQFHRALAHGGAERLGGHSARRLTPSTPERPNPPPLVSPLRSLLGAELLRGHSASLPHVRPSDEKDLIPLVVSLSLRRSWRSGRLRLVIGVAGLTSVDQKDRIPSAFFTAPRRSLAAEGFGGLRRAGPPSSQKDPPPRWFHCSGSLLSTEGPRGFGSPPHAREPDNRIPSAGFTRSARSWERKVFVSSARRPMRRRQKDRIPLPQVSLAPLLTVERSFGCIRRRRPHFRRARRPNPLRCFTLSALSPAEERLRGHSCRRPHARRRRKPNPLRCFTRSVAMHVESRLLLHKAA